MNTLEKGALAVLGLCAGAWLWRRMSRPAYDFREKVVLITGGSRGLGLVLARQFAAKGAKLALCARDAAELDLAAENLRQDGIDAFVHACDVSDGSGVREMVARTEAALGPVNVLVNNAGIIQVGPAETMTREDYEQSLRVHFWGCYNTVEAVLPGMRQRRDGRIVNISSIGGKVSVPHMLPYSVGKFALVGYSQGLRSAVASDNVLVTTVCPGLMRTGSPRNAEFKGQHRAEYAWFAVSDSLPLLTVSAESAARSIVEACRRGDAEAVLSLPARLATFLHQMFPETAADLLSLVNRLLPGPSGPESVGTEKRSGAESESSLAPSLLTTLTDQAARRNNEMATNT